MHEEEKGFKKDKNQSVLESGQEKLTNSLLGFLPLE
jgi:hypothetical protein